MSAGSKAERSGVPHMSRRHAPGARRRGPISRRLRAVARTIRSGDLTLGELIDDLQAEGLGLTLLLLTLPALIPLPGPFGMVFGTLVAAVAIQILFGAERLWLPQRLRRRAVPPRLLRNVIRVGLDWTDRAERGLREDRLPWLTGRIARMLLALPLLLMAVTIILPIPLGNMLPALALIAAAIGFMARDGLAVLLSLLIAAIAVIWTAMLLYAGASIASHAADAVHWTAAHLRSALAAHDVDLGVARAVTNALTVVTACASAWLWRRRWRQRRQTRRSSVAGAAALAQDRPPAAAALLSTITAVCFAIIAYALITP